VRVMSNPFIEAVHELIQDEGLAYQFVRSLVDALPYEQVQKFARVVAMEIALKEYEWRKDRILGTLRDHGLTARVQDGKLLVSPEKKITPALRAVIVVYRAELVEAIREREAKKKSG
jgi:hypothetical protein